MATNFTIDDIKKKLAANGLTLSDADMSLAERNPDAGMSIVNYKLDYKNAATDEDRAAANKGAEGIRTSYGGYTGGVDGSGFYLDKPSPQSFTYEDAPTYTSQRADSNNAIYDKVKNYGSFTYDKAAPTYTDTLEGQRLELIDAIANPGEFSYDHKSDPSYSAFAKQYRREGERVSANALAQAAANTGGVASTAAMAAAQQAGNYYGAQLADKIPELEGQAYDRYLNNISLKQNALAAMQQESANEYDKYLNELTQYNADRNLALDLYNDEYNKLLTALEYGVALDESDYAKYLDALSQHNTDKNFAYGQLLDSIDHINTGEQTAFNRADHIAQTYGDLSGVKGLGINTDWYQKQLDNADAISQNELAASKLERAILNQELANAQTGSTVDEETAALRNDAEYIKAMLTASGNEAYAKLTVDDIMVMLQNGYTGFDNLIPLTAPVPYTSGELSLGGLTPSERAQAMQAINNNAKVVSYYNAYEGIIPEGEWRGAKNQGVNASPFEYSSYEEYVNAYHQYLLENSQ